MLHILPPDHTKYHVGLESNEYTYTEQSTDGALDLAWHAVLPVSSTCRYKKLHANSYITADRHRHIHPHNIQTQTVKTPHIEIYIL